MMMSAVMKQESERFIVLLHLGWESSSIIHLSWSIHLSPIQVKLDLIFWYSESEQVNYLVIITIFLPTIKEEAGGPETRYCVSHHRGIIEPGLCNQFFFFFVNNEKFSSLEAGNSVVGGKVIVEVVMVYSWPLPVGGENAHGKSYARQGWNRRVTLKL